MQKLLDPGLLLVNRLRYSRKFMLVAALMIMLVVVTMYYLLGQLNKDIVFAEKERMGLRSNIALQDVMTTLQENRHLAYLAQHGDADAQGKLPAAQLKVDQAMSVVQAIEVELDNKLETKEAWANIQRNWTDLKSQSQATTNAQDQYDKSTALLANLSALTATIGDTSKLILDPDLDSYYLMDATLTRLPTLAEEISQLRDTSTTFAGTKSLTLEETTKLIYKTMSITAALDAVNYGTNVVNRQNPALAPVMDKALKPVNDSLTSFKQSFTDTYINPTSKRVSPQEIEQNATHAITSIQTQYQTEVKLLDELLETRRDHYAGIKHFVIGFVGVVFFLVLYVFAAFYLSIMKAIRRMSDSLHEVADGNLLTNIPVETHDEMGEAATAFNSMVEAVKTILITSQQTADQVTLASDKMVSIADETSKANQQLVLSMQETVKGANQQLSGTVESSVAIREMSMGVQRIASSTKAVSDHSQKASWSASEGNQAIDKVMQQMETIQDSVQHTAGSIQRLHTFSQQVHQFAEVIRRIAGQTKMLALNASIEAARVGEHGRGFTVVAEETKDLAEQSAKSAEEIYALIQLIQDASVHSVASMESVIHDVENGRSAVQESNESFRSIINASYEIAAQIQDISAASEEMASTSEQVSATISDISQVTKDSFEAFQTISDMSAAQVTMMQDLESRAQFLNEMSQSLRDQIGRFTLKDSPSTDM